MGALRGRLCLRRLLGFFPGGLGLFCSILFPGLFNNPSSLDGSRLRAVKLWGLFSRLNQITEFIVYCPVVTKDFLCFTIIANRVVVITFWSFSVRFYLREDVSMGPSTTRDMDLLTSIRLKGFFWTEGFSKLVS